MKTNKMMRIASVMLVAALLSTCAISGTFAKYTSTDNKSDNARVAKWGFGDTTLEFADLFSDDYTDVKSNNGDNVIAPGTEGNATFTFAPDTDANPEVAYSLAVSTEGSSCDSAIEDNTNIVWSLGGTTYGTWDELLTAIEALSEESINAGTAKTITGTVYWKWLFDESVEGATNLDSTDTTMGDAASANVTLKITVTATQLNTK